MDLADIIYKMYPAGQVTKHEYKKLEEQLVSPLERIAELEAELAKENRKLEREIKYGHRNCTVDNCASSGVCCPKAKEVSNDEQ